VVQREQLDLRICAVPATDQDLSTVLRMFHQIRRKLGGDDADAMRIRLTEAGSDRDSLRGLPSPGHLASIDHRDR
jgi:hypothetical protein